MRPMMLLSLCAFACLAGAGGARAMITAAPSFAPPAFSRGTLAQPGVASVDFSWGAATFQPATSDDQVDVVVSDQPAVTDTLPLSGGATGGTLFLTNGQQYAVRILACEVPASTSLCSDLPAGQVSSSASALTRVDATPPSGTVQIDGGAPATNQRVVTLDLAASDPLIDGLPGSASGVTQMALDVDGDGVYPCPSLTDPGASSSGCAVPFAATAASMLTPGDGLKTVGVRFGDGAREAPCIAAAGTFCLIQVGSPILGNASASATDTIILDTVKPIALSAQDRFTVERGGTVTFDASGSVDQSPAIGSGVDPASATWDFKDGSPPASGPRLSHVFTSAGTFVGELRVADRAGNQSDPRPFSVTVTPRRADLASGGAAAGAISAQGASTFKIDRLSVRARYVRSRLRGSILLVGSSSQAGPLRVEIRPPGRGRVRRLVGTVGLGAFATRLGLPADLLPGTYRIALVGPGGTLQSSLTLIAPREGVLGGGSVSASRRGALAVFRLAAPPARALRARLTVAWSQRGRRLGVVRVTSGARVRAALPAAAIPSSGPVRARLRAGGIVVGELQGIVALGSRSRRRASG